MGKRKRNNKSEQTEYYHLQHKRPRSTKYGPSEVIATSTAQGQNPVESGSISTTAAPIHEALAHAIRLLEPPSGLSKRQRKRWRLLTRRAAESVNTGNANPTDQIATQTSQAQDTHATSRDTRKIVDQSIVKRYSTTDLVPKPQKRWHDYVKNQDSPQRQRPPQKSSARDETPLNEKSNLYLEQSGSEISKAEKEPSPVAAIDKSTTDIDTTSKSNHVVTQSRTRQTIPASSLTSFITRNTPISMTFRRSSTGKKPTSIPSFLENADVESSFKRFTAFVSGRNADSDDQSEDSEEESDSEISDRTDHSLQREDSNEIQLEGHQDNNPALLAGRNEHSEKLPATNPDPSKLHAASPAVDEDDSFPQFRQTGSTQAPTIPFSRQANIGVKRQLSFLGVEPGGTPSGSGRTGDPDFIPTKEPTRLHHLPIPFDESDNDSEYMLQTIEEISRNVFAATRPLPASKLPDSPDPEREDQENSGLMNSASSARRVTRSMSTPKNTPKRDRLSEITTPQRTAIICNSLQVPEFHGTQPHTKMARPAPGLEISDSADNIDAATNTIAQEASSSSLSEFSRSPSPPPITDAIVLETQHDQLDDDPTEHAEPEQEDAPKSPGRKKRKMTGRTSKHFTPEKRRSKRTSLKDNNEPEIEVKIQREAAGEPSKPLNNSTGPEAAREEASPPPVSHSTRSSTAKKNPPTRKGTGKKSSYFTPTKPPLDLSVIDRVDLYNTTAGSRSKTNRGRAAAGTSTAPAPPITEPHFGIIQEKLWREPFWLLVAVTFLNKTTGRAAVPVFWELKKKYRTPEGLAAAKEEDLEGLIWHLGLQRQRSRRILKIARAWVEDEPVRERRWRTLHYPLRGDGKEFKATGVVEEDADECSGALEIGHIPGCGPYAWDSWRIFCRDVLRGVADDYNGAGAEPERAEVEVFVPEWKKVLPLDKELRACLRWMWLKEGWIWDCESGERREATEEEMEMAFRGEMEIEDEAERKFAERAVAGVEEEGGEVEVESPRFREGEGEPETSAVMGVEDDGKSEDEVEVEDSASDNIVVSPAARPVRRSGRTTA